jgi:hypothetical protein
VDKEAGTVHYNHPQHGIVSIQKQPSGEFHVKHNGGLAGVEGVKGIFSNPKDAGKHARKYMEGVSRGKILPQKMHSHPSPSMLGKNEELQKSAIHEGIHEFGGKKHHVQINKLRSGRYNAHVSLGEHPIQAPGSIHTLDHTYNPVKNGFKISHETPYAGEHYSSPTSTEIRNFVTQKVKEHHQSKNELKKAIEAGSYNAAPSTLTNGAAYQTESLGSKQASTGAEENQFHGTKKKDWNRQAKDDYERWPHKEKFEKFMKARMPHLKDGEIRALGRALALKKNIDLEKSLNNLVSLQKKSEKIDLVHYSSHPNLTEVDPKHHGTGVDARTKGRDTWHPHSFYYKAGTKPEDVVVGRAPHKYHATIDPSEHKLYDIGSDPEHIVAHSPNMEAVHEKLKEKGYHGFHNSKHDTLSHVVAMYHPLKVQKLEKGEKGDWKKEGYSLKHTINDGFHMVHAFDKHGNKVGHAGFAPLQESHGWTGITPSKTHLGVTTADVRPDHQRKGLASAMYNLAEQKTGMKIKEGHGTAGQSPDAKALWANKNRTFGKSEDLNKSESGPTHNPKIRQVAEQHMASKGVKLEHPGSQAKVNPEFATKVASAYHNMKHEPNHPDVKRSYDALKNETAAQYQAIKNAGLKVSKIKPGQQNPYKNSKDVLNDIHNNNHLWYFPTESGFGSGDKYSDHPMLEPTTEMHEGKPMLANDMFRIVHDYFGHAKEGNGFGPNGEENAYQNHAKMYSPEAQKALTTETRSQNSWVNFGPHGAHNRANPANTVYADQKAGIMPDWAHEINPGKK